MTEPEATVYLDQIHKEQATLRETLTRLASLIQASPLGSATEDALIGNLQTHFKSINTTLIPVRTSYIDWIYNLLHTA